MTFVHPIWLYIGAATCVSLALLMFWSWKRRMRNLRRFVGDREAGHTIPSLSYGRRWIKALFLILGTASIFIALAQPLWGYHWQEAKQEGIDLMFAVDTSRSMLAEDIRPNRLARAKLAVEDLAERVPGDRFGLIAFAGDAFLQTPLTLDRDVFAMSLAALDTDVIPVGGTDVAAAIRAAEDAFKSGENNRKILVILSDGEDLEGAAMAAAKKATERGMVIYTVGIGTASGELIPIHDAKGRTSLLRDEQGQPVRSRLDEAGLRAIAEATGGSYQPLGQSGQGLDVLYRNSMSTIPKSSVQSRMSRVYHQQFQWPLGLGVCLLLLELLIGERRSQRSAVKRRVRTAAAGAALALCIVAGGSTDVWASPRGESSVALYNAATEQYRAGSYKDADDGFSRALDTSDVRLQQSAYYNLGNTRYRLGERSRESQVEQTVALWKAALKAYDAALALDPDDGDAKFNRDLVAKKLAELEKQQDEEKQQKESEKKSESGEGDQKEQQDSKSGQGDQKEQQDSKSGQGDQKDSKSGQGDQKDQQDSKSGQAPTKADEQPKDGETPAQPKQGETPQPDPKDTKGNGGVGSPETPPGMQGAQPGRAATAGGLSRAEAAQLLNSLEGDLRRLPFAYGTRSKQQRLNDNARKNW